MRLDELIRSGQLSLTAKPFYAGGFEFFTQPLYFRHEVINRVVE